MNTNDILTGGTLFELDDEMLEGKKYSYVRGEGYGPIAYIHCEPATAVKLAYLLQATLVFD